MSAPPFFSEALRLAEAGPGLWRGEADPAYSNGLAGAFIGQFGGWSAALLLKAALAEAGPGQSARALNVHFFTPVRPGALSVRTRALRKGKSVSFWQAELAQGEDVRAQAVITLGAARAGALAHHFAAFPQASPPETEGLADFSPPTPFGQALQARWVTGAPFSGDQSGRSLLWSRTAAPSLADAPKLALLADYMPPRVFYLANNFVPSSTLSMSVYFHASADEYAALGDDFTLVEVNGRRVGEGYWDHSAAFWSRHGALIATTEQISIHRG